MTKFVQSIKGNEIINVTLLLMTSNDYSCRLEEEG